MKTTLTSIREFLLSYLEGSEYELMTLEVDSENNLLVEIDHPNGIDVDFCAEVNSKLVEWLDQVGEPDYAVEVGSYSLSAPFKSKLQYNKHLGEDVVVRVVKANEPTNQHGVKFEGQLISVDEDTFSIDAIEKVEVTTPSGKTKRKKENVTHSFRYDEAETLLKF